MWQESTLGMEKVILRKKKGSFDTKKLKYGGKNKSTAADGMPAVFMAATCGLGSRKSRQKMKAHLLQVTL
jgi:hypothetical protein